MAKLLYRVINPVVKGLLRSPLHGLMSGNTLLLEFKGRKSGRTFTTPVSYRETDDGLHCFTDKQNRWWRNLQHGDPVTLTLRGRTRTGRPTVHADGSEVVRSALHEMLLAVPRDAAHAGVALEADGTPRAADVAEASQRLVLISIEL